MNSTCSLNMFLQMAVPIINNTSLFKFLPLSVSRTYSRKPFTKSIPNSSHFFQKSDVPFPDKRRALQHRKNIMLFSPVTVAPLLEEVEEEEEEEVPVKLKMIALVTVRKFKMQHLEMMLHPLHNFINPNNKDVVLQLVSADVNPRTLQPNLSNEATLQWSRRFKTEDKLITYRVEFMVASDFGVPGAILVSNKYQAEFYLESITTEGFVSFACNSWIQPETIHPEKRIFFTNKAYLPCHTPSGLKVLREMDLKQLRGDGKGERKLSDRIYDYDVYNDLGNPDKGKDHARPILAGENYPLPRRCRTGRPPNSTDAKTESSVNASKPMYVPRDEAFDDCKWRTMTKGKLKIVFRDFIHTMKIIPNSDDGSVKRISDINRLYKSRTDSEMKLQNAYLKNISSSLILNKILEFITGSLQFEPPKAVSRNGSSFCLSDYEFGRLQLAGLNPLSIERLQVFPPVSKLDPSINGTCESALKEEHIIDHLGGMSVQQALEANKLFILDYHDIYLPFLDQINALENRKQYATRTIFFLTPYGTLKPVAIELSLPSGNSGYPLKQVLTPSVDATTNWLWQLGKAHVCSNDAGVHQLVHHWLRSHGCIEPFIIAAHRQLSKMHPVQKLLHPHMRYNLELNSQARQFLIKEGGIIESFFSPARYSMDITATAYKDLWRFDLEGLPADLIRRGMAVPDATQPCGVRLVIEDYPYASDGLLIWSAIEKLVSTYVNYYYSDANHIISDMELQCWYKECINVGHADHRHDNWWPKLSSPQDLISILTTIIWITTAQHAATNFGQYHYGGYVPTRPPLMRRLLPKKHDIEYKNFLKDPELYYLSSLPSLQETTYYMSVLELLSTHEEDEEYLGDRKDLSIWSGEPKILEAFYEFSMELKNIEKKIEKRNNDPNLRNRCGAGISPYELLMPSSEPGISGRGVPNSISL